MRFVTEKSCCLTISGQFCVIIFVKQGRCFMYVEEEKLNILQQNTPNFNLGKQFLLSFVNIYQ